MALGALIIQTKFQDTERELAQQITENPYLLEAKDDNNFPSSGGSADPKKEAKKKIVEL